ncbi:unnamed protein product (macronuclear) [Paramecium tetraurelia]|uniref:Sfi1 spindle body domain-containing protein n=1 Tax=Paramecium tetraurelia TaxID=5888 RepID=A0CN47_PARTE|nr:uncharacterized protein GSPATT00008655001 [Paramecium tetraurelia]CAK72214.1 unnamed protein product [Paramecium tetraurelia]|eukprot:XP_001439611.1 hypothetical protein (macronuclear) [Paramecium tetraurelia strain d4-2]
MNNEYEFLSEILKQWHKITQKQIKQRQSVMSIMYTKDQNLLKNAFQGWIKRWYGQKNYKYKRDLFYKKLLIFNYKFLIRKYFNGFIQNSKRLVTLHYKKEMANNFRSQQIQKLKRKILRAFIANITTSQNIKQIQQRSLRLYFKLWNSETRKLQLKNKLTKDNGNLNNVEQWVQQKRSNRIQPKIYQENPDQQPSLPQQQTKSQTNEQKVQKQVTPKKEKINEDQKAYAPDQINQIQSINDLNQYLQLKMMEYEYYTGLPNKNVNVIKQIKLEIKLTLEKIQEFRGQQ